MLSANTLVAISIKWRGVQQMTPVPTLDHLAPLQKTQVDLFCNASDEQFWVRSEEDLIGGDHLCRGYRKYQSVAGIIRR